MADGRVQCGFCGKRVAQPCITFGDTEQRGCLEDYPRAVPFNTHFLGDLPGEVTPFIPLRKPDPYED